MYYNATLLEVFQLHSSTLFYFPFVASGSHKSWHLPRSDWAGTLALVNFARVIFWRKKVKEIV